MGYRSAITAVFYTNKKDEWPLMKYKGERGGPPPVDILNL